MKDRANLIAVENRRDALTLYFNFAALAILQSKLFQGVSTMAF